MWKRVSRQFLALGILAGILGLALGGCLFAPIDHSHDGAGGGGQAGAAGNTGGAGDSGAAGAGGTTSSDLCMDGVKNGSETDIDCGNAACGPCVDGKTCGDKDGQSSACESEQCFDGVCCHEACTSLCRACVSDKTGQPDGTCAPVKGDTDPDNDCMNGGNKKCDLSGLCDGIGACAVIGCKLDHATSMCDSSQKCQIGTCDQGFADCDMSPGNGCEVNVTSSATNCGSCGHMCGMVQNGVAGCAAGLCVIASCNGMHRDCNGDYNDGCESDIQIDVNNCGACQKACAFDHAAASCQDSTCMMGACDSGWGNCNALAGDGCEHDVSKDVENCGACDRACSGDNVASKSCSNGTCSSACQLGWANCNEAQGDPKNDGCELDVSSGTNGANMDGNNSGANINCGGCGNSCSVQGHTGDYDFECNGGASGQGQKYCGCSSTEECTGGIGSGSCGAGGLCICDMAQCKPGEACVYDLQAGKNVCTCQPNAGGAACGVGKTCCQTPAGCFDLQADPMNCGACGHACANGFTCFMGSCSCDENSDCNAGAAGTCDNVSGLCTCSNMECNPGARCQPGGQCG